MVIKGGTRYGENNLIYYSDSQPANLLRTFEVQNSVFHFSNTPSREEINLLPRGATVSNTLAARVSQPMNCRTLWDKMAHRDQDDEPPSGGGGGGRNYEPPQFGPTHASAQTAVPHQNSVNTQKSNSDWYVTKKMSLTDSAMLVLNLLTPILSSVVAFLPVGWSSPKSDVIVVKDSDLPPIEETRIKSAPQSYNGTMRKPNTPSCSGSMNSVKKPAANATDFPPADSNTNPPKPKPKTVTRSGKHSTTSYLANTITS